jgi:hypothetical protein
MTNAILEASHSNSLTIFTMLGGRASVVDLHLKSLDKYTSKHTRKVCLLPSKNKIKTLALCSQYDDDFQFLSREDFGFHLKPTPDVNYDRLFEKFCGTEKFIFLHDDTILESSLETYLNAKFDSYDFVGARDDAVKSGQYNQYSKILFDGQSMADIRIGTWFMAGIAEVYRHHKLSVGYASRLFPLWSNFIFKTLRLRIRGLTANSDGGFNFNIKARKLNLRINRVDPDCDNVAVHFSRVAAGFINRGLHEFVDQPNEVDIWHERLSGHLLNNNFEAYKKDLDFLKGIYQNLKKYSVHDELICLENIERFSALQSSLKS